MPTDEGDSGGNTYDGFTEVGTANEESFRDTASLVRRKSSLRAGSSPSHRDSGVGGADGKRRSRTSKSRPSLGV